MRGRRGGVQLDLFADLLAQADDERMAPGAKATECPYCFFTYGTHAEGCARPRWAARPGRKGGVADEGSAWLAAYWAAAPAVRRGRFKAMTGRRGAGLRQDVPVTRPVCLTGETR